MGGQFTLIPTLFHLCIDCLLKLDKEQTYFKEEYHA